MHLVSAFDSEQMVGLGRIISDGQLYALIVDVIVLPAYRGQGIGTTIMKQLLEHCRSSEIRDVKLFAARGKSAFYQLFGFLERSPEAPGMELRCGHDAQTAAIWNSN
jgi:predicted GNAT family N-acyltransferase